MQTDAQSVAGQHAGNSGPARPGNLTVAALIDRYMAAYAGRDESRARRLLWWSEKLGTLLLADVTDDHVFHLLEELAERPARVYAGRDADGKPIHRAKGGKLAPATVNRYGHALAAVFTWGIRKRLVPKGWESPCRRLERRRENNERVRFLSDGERERLFAACRASKWPKLYALVLLAITTGARRGELLGLRWVDVDFERAVASVDRTKNGDRKALPLVPAVLEELQRLGAGRPDALVFASRRRPDLPYHFGTVWDTALKAAKVRDFRFHDLRHSCASYLAQSGATLLEIADVLGHRQLNVTRRYSHLTTQHKAKLINRVLGEIR